MINKLYDLIESIIYPNNNSNTTIQKTGDLMPKGIKSTIKSDNHGNPNDYNITWKHIYTQRKTLNKI